MIDVEIATRRRHVHACPRRRQGNPSLQTPLEFVRFELYVMSKRSLTGDSSERVDTRVLQVIYRFSADRFPIHVGQQMDVFIEARQSPRSQVKSLESQSPWLVRL